MSDTGILARLSGSIIVLWGWRAALAALIAGALSSLSMAPFHFFPILFATLPVLVWLIDGAISDPGSNIFQRLWPAAKIGWLFGFGYFLASMWWLGNAFLVDASEFAWALPFAVCAVPAGLAVYWGLGAAFARIFWADGWRRIVALALGLGLAEYLRGTLFTGLPWNALGLAAMPTPLMMQSASVLGLYGVTLFAILVFASPAIFAPGGSSDVGSARPRRMRALFTVCLTLTVLHVGFGFLQLSSSHTGEVKDFSIRLVQPNIAQREKWQEGKESEIFRRYVTLSNKASSPDKQSLKGTNLLLWPESAFPFILTEEPDAIAAIAALLPEGTRLVTGAMRTEAPVAGKTSGFTFNSLFLIGANGEIQQARDKVHLVPFGEYLPFQEALEAIGLNQLTRLPGGFTPGNERKTVAVENAPAFLPLICYEIIFPNGLEYSGPKPGWILNLTNDAWFGVSPGPFQHLHQAQVRAVEQGLPVVRVANSGISAVIDPFGRITHSIGLNKSGIIDASLPIARSRTIFTQGGNWPFLGGLLAFILLLTLKPSKHHESSIDRESRLGS